MSKGVWVLTSEVNEYDQHGAYFRAVFERKPTLKELAGVFGMIEGTPGNVMDAVVFLEHLLAGAGRQKTEHEWFNLEFVPFGGDVKLLMPPFPTPTASTVRAIYAAYEAANEHYDSLGISVGEIGEACDRALWYTLHWASQPEQLDGRKIRLFDTGNREETRLVEDLERIGVEVYGQQDRIRLVSGFVRGKCDGKAMGIPEAPKTEHLLEFKSTNEKGMQELQKKRSVKDVKPLHYGQCQIGMHAFGLKRCLYLAVSKDTDTLYAERIEHDVEYCIRQLARAERLVRAAETAIADKRKARLLWLHALPAQRNLP